MRRMKIKKRMAVKRITGRDRQTVHFLKWIRDHPGWWYLICTPDDRRLNMCIMKTLIKNLAGEELYEIIFVLLMVHRNEEFMKDFPDFMLTEMMKTNWAGKTKGREGMIRDILEYFE